MPANPDPSIIEANQNIIKGVKGQIKDLQPGANMNFAIAAALKELSNLQGYNDLAGRAVPHPVGNRVSDIKTLIQQIQSGTKEFTEFGTVLGDLNTLKFQLENTPSDSNKSVIEGILAGILRQITMLLNYRPNVDTIMGDLEAIKNLRGGPADAIAFHDFHILQLAYKSVWLHSFDENLRIATAQLYDEIVHQYEDAGLTAPALDAIQDVHQLRTLLKPNGGIVGGVFVPPPPALGSRNNENSLGENMRPLPLTPEIISAYPEVSLFWNDLSHEKQISIQSNANIINNNDSTREEKEAAKKSIADLLKVSEGQAGRLTKLILEIGHYLNEPYAFDVFAPDSYNFGIMVTYRQKWEPGKYQAGDLAATIPLAPGETRKYSKKRVVKKTRAEKEIEKSMSSRSEQSSQISRAESEIMKKTTTATNFKMTTNGSFNIGIASFGGTSEFGTNQERISIDNKKNFHEATIKAAEEYRLERSMEVDTTSSVESEDTYSGEISNPNNEITVTYLFYELQRRFKISESIYRARPVVMIAQDVPAPHEIDEAWLIQYQWIIARVLLDDSFRPALNYLTSGFAGDEVSVEVIKAHWMELRNTVSKLEGEVTSQLSLRTDLRKFIVQSQLQQKVDNAENKFDVANFIFNPFQDKAGAIEEFAKTATKNEVMEANREAAETRLQYVEQALADAQEKYRQSSGAFQQATKEYAAALQNQYTRHIAIDQLRIHLKQNILYYMQAIWNTEFEDQQFFRLYNKKVICPKQMNCAPTVVPTPPTDVRAILAGSFRINRGIATVQGSEALEIENLCVPTLTGGGVGGDEVDLIEIADLDNPLGYKGNYIIFPLKVQCDITTHMLTEFFDEFTGIKDPDKYANRNFDIETFDAEWNKAIKAQDEARQIELRNELEKYAEAERRTTDEIIVPTGQLFIEALPGSHTLLEDFKLMHRFEDVRKVKAEVRHAELENLRLASRLVAGQDDSKLLEDPDIEKKIIVEGKASVVIPPNS